MSAWHHSDRLLGKWRIENQGFREAHGFYLEDHIHETLVSAYSLQYRSSFLRDLYNAMELGRGPEGVTRDQFYLLVLLGTLLHDYGKIGMPFQKMLGTLEHAYQGLVAQGLTGKELFDAYQQWKVVAGRPKQLWRHELLSAFLVEGAKNPTMRDWLNSQLYNAGLEDVDKYRRIAVAAALGHHRKAEAWVLGEERAPQMLSRDEVVKLGEDPSKLHRLPLERFTRDLGDRIRASTKGKFPELGSLPILPNAGISWDRLNAFRREIYDTQDPETPLSYAVKWSVLLADTLGSLCARQAEEPHVEARARFFKEWLSDEQPKKQDFELRIQKKLGGSLKRQYAHQREVQQRGSVLLCTPTGSGKSNAALLWANMEPDKPLLWAMPTTELASQAFLEYGLDEDAVRHSKTWFDVELFDTQGEAEEEGKGKRSEDGWSAVGFPKVHGSITFTTYDQVIGGVGFNHKSILWLPHIVRAQVVFDESHVLSHDPLLLSAHDAWLRVFPGIRTLHMTATFPEKEKRIQALNGAPMVLPDGKDVPDNAPRYRLEECALGSLPTPLDGCLWVQNTVGRVQDLANQLPDALVYHSRYKFEERKRIRAQVMAALGAQGRTGVVLSSQVAELGLDLYANHLISEVCSPASFIQRLGRVNRDRVPQGVAPVHFYMPENGAPYDTSSDWLATFEKWRAWLKQFEGRDVSTAELREASVVDVLDPESRMVELMRTRQDRIRDIRWTYDVILKEDADQNPDRKRSQELSITTFLFPKDLPKEKRFHKGLIVLDFDLMEPGWFYFPRLGLVRPRSP